LGIEREQPVGLFRVSARRGLPLQQAALSVKLTDGIDVGDELVLSSNRPGELDLQIALRLADLDAIVLAESVKQRSSGAGLRSYKQTIRSRGLPRGSSRRNKAPRACSKARPKSIAARVSFSFQPSR
jgi:hypothetical protein